MILPEDIAFDFLRFCQRNPKPCPLLGVSEIGDPGIPALGADLDVRTDLPAYRVWQDGALAEECADISRWWREDLVAFALGCSFSFEAALLEEGLEVRHIASGTNVPMYTTRVPCVPAGRFAGPLVVSMRPFSPADAIRAIQITSRFPSVHGAPVHLGAPEQIGIQDLQRPDYGDAVEVRAGELPVFWACGVTPQAVIAASRVPFAITHAPGAMLVTDLRNRQLALTQGVTTASIGNDGFGGYDVAGQATKLRSRPAGHNTVLFVGFGPVRQSELGMENQVPSEAQLAEMKRHIAKGMCEGAIGFSTGLIYTPQALATTEEVVELARVAASYGGIHDSHVRNESVGLKDAIDEAIRIGREAGLPVHVAHIKALGADVHGTSGEIVTLIERAQAGGVRIHADQYPWMASSTQFSAALIPSWALAGGREEMLTRFNDPAQAARLRAGIAENLRIRGGPEAILFTVGNGRYAGKYLAEVMKWLSIDAVDATMAVLREGNTAIANFNMAEEDVRTFMKRPWVSTSSDSSDGHPRAYGELCSQVRRVRRSAEGDQRRRSSSAAAPRGRPTSCRSPSEAGSKRATSPTL